jgi:peptide-methionine (R)-S-oxide reductase
MKICFLFVFTLATIFTGCGVKDDQSKSNSMAAKPKDNPHYSNTDTNQLGLRNEDWRKVLPAEVYKVAREKGTERAFRGKYNLHKDTGTYYCAACGNPLFESNGKFESNCGWPSFFEPISKGSLVYAPDTSHNMRRTEVMCGRCKAHLGHVFEDGPPPTGLRYCINSVILDFEAAQEAAKKSGK